jgi:tetratricopeptide (TPR) repeat protein
MAALLILVVINGCSAETNKVKLLEHAQRDLAAGQYDDARIEFLKLLQSDPDNAAVIHQLGVIWFDEGAPLQALPFLLRMREIAPDNLDARTKLGLVLQFLGEISEARKEAVAILDLAPIHDEAIILLADTSRTQQEVNETEQRLQKFTDHRRVSFHLALASLALRKGDLVSAEKEIKQGLTLDQKSPSAHLAMAGLLSLRKDSVRSGQELKIAAELSPVRSAARLRYAEFQANTGAVDDATAITREITRQAPDYLPAWGCLAKFAYTAKRYDESLALLDNVFNRDPLNLEGRLLQSEIWLAMGEAKLAVEGLDRLNKTYPNVPVAKYQLARAYLLNDNPAQAAVTLDRALALNPDYVEASLLLGETNLRAGEAQPVISSMKGLLTKHPAQTEAQVLLAAAYQSVGRLDDAAAVFRQLVGAFPESARFYLGLGLILRGQGKTAEARTAFEKAQELEPSNLAAVEQLLDLDLLSRDFTSAAQKVSRQLEKTPLSADAHYFEGKLYAAQGEWNQAEAALLKAIELDPDSPNAYDLLISAYVAGNQLSQAIGQIDRQLSRDPNNTRLLMLSGLIYDKSNQFPQAQAAYEKLLSLRPDFGPALNNLAYLYAERSNQPDKAYDLARKARALSHDDAATADTLGWILYRRAEFDQALLLLKESAAKLPNTPEIQFHLGMAYYMMGQMDAARTTLRQAAEAKSDFPGKGDIERRLALLPDSSGKLPGTTAEELQSILQQQPGDVVAWLRLGEAYEKQANFVKAAAAYEQAVKVNPRLFPAVVKLASLYAGPLPDKDKAAEFGRKARQFAPEAAAAPDAPSL